MQASAKKTQLPLYPQLEKVEQNYTSTFGDNMTMPVHRWFRFTAGFSANWVRNLIKEEKKNGRSHIVEPFAGSGTVLIESNFANVEARGVEAHPYIYRIAQTKLRWNTNPEFFLTEMLQFLEKAKGGKSCQTLNYPDLIIECYPVETLQRLDILKNLFLTYDKPTETRDFIWFIITSILRSSSPVGTAQWQYVLPNKTKSKVLEPFSAFERKVLEMYKDMTLLKNRFPDVLNKSVIFQDDARIMSSLEDNWGDLVITSPPYANNYDYADATRLELTFWGDIDNWGGLQDQVRKYLIRACTQHVSNLGADIDGIINHDRLAPIREELIGVYEKLKIERLSHGGKKNYHFMITAYFKDLADVFFSLRRVMKEDSLMCFVIGDSAPYGIYVPVDQWLGKLAISAGFKEYRFEKLRDRNIKWKNRKHKVPLKEGRLWING